MFGIDVVDVVVEISKEKHDGLSYPGKVRHLGGIHDVQVAETAML